MVSFEDHRQIEEAAEVCRSVVLDNGAFSAWQQGKVHDFAGYQCWTARWLRHSAVEWAVIPDVIDGTEAQNDEGLRTALPPDAGVLLHISEHSQRLLVFVLARTPGYVIDQIPPHRIQIEPKAAPGSVVSTVRLLTIANLVRG